MAGAFQANAFQNNAFQVDAGPPPSTGSIGAKPGGLVRNLKPTGGRVPSMKPSGRVTSPRPGGTVGS